MVTVTLDPKEWQFLITTLEGTSAILKSLGALQGAVPLGLPITTETIVSIAALTEQIKSQTAPIDI